MATNTNIKYTPYEGEKYKIELAAERINALLKALDIADGAEELTEKTLEDLNAIIETIKDWDDSDDSLGVKEQLLNIYNSMLSEEEFNKSYLPEIDEDIADVNERVDTLENQIGDVSNMSEDIQAIVDETLALQEAYIAGTTTDTGTGQGTSGTVTVHTHTATQITSGTFASTDVKAAAGTDYTNERLRNVSLNAVETTPSANGAIAWVYK